MSVQDRINGYWSERAPAYDADQQRPEHEPAWSRVWASALGDAPLDVLDVGTGPGPVARTVAGLGHRVTGIDLSDGMLDRARAHAAAADRPPTFLRGDAVAPPFPAGSFDAVIGRYVMWTLRSPATALANWIGLLRPGGLVAMVDSTWFPDGLAYASGDLFRSAYDAEVDAALPLAGASTIGDTVDTLTSAGLVGVRVEPLEEILELDRRYGVSAGHEVRLQYLVTGRRAG